MENVKKAVNVKMDSLINVKKATLKSRASMAEMSFAIVALLVTFVTLGSSLNVQMEVILLFRVDGLFFTVKSVPSITTVHLVFSR